jgi:hypothetical protein
MDEKLRSLEGKRVDINCGAGAMFRGTVREVAEKVVTIFDEDDQNTSISIKKIISVTECADPVTRPGFIV